MKLKELLDCKLGVAINEKNIETHRDLIVNEFNSVTFENALKFNYIIKEDLSYDLYEKIGFVELILLMKRVCTKLI